MQAYRRSSTVTQMGAALLTFAAVALLLESGGLYDWAQRLELGPERTLALPVATVLHRGLRGFGLERLRNRELVALARVGWSDDPVALAEAYEAKSALAGPTQTKLPYTATAVVAATVKTPPHSILHLPTKPIAGAPPLFSKLPGIAPVEAGKTRIVALAGDSMMAVGLSPTMLRRAPQYKDLLIVRLFKSGTGLARPEIFNWQQEYPAMLKKAASQNAPPEFILVAIGANDGQGFVQDGTTYPFGSEGWKAIYQQRVQSYLAMLEADGATVVWLGLPPMKNSAYDERIALVNRIDYAVVKSSPQAIWFSTAGLVGDADGHFQDFGSTGGFTVRLRQPDGIHLTDDGALLIAERLLPWLSAQEPSIAPPTLRPPPIKPVTTQRE